MNYWIPLAANMRRNARPRSFRLMAALDRENPVAVSGQTRLSSRRRRARLDRLSLNELKALSGGSWPNDDSQLSPNAENKFGPYEATGTLSITPLPQPKIY